MATFSWFDRLEINSKNFKETDFIWFSSTDVLQGIQMSNEVSIYTTGCSMLYMQYAGDTSYS